MSKNKVKLLKPCEFPGPCTATEYWPESKGGGLMFVQKVKRNSAGKLLELYYCKYDFDGTVEYEYTTKY